MNWICCLCQDGSIFFWLCLQVGPYYIFELLCCRLWNTCWWKHTRRITILAFSQSYTCRLNILSSTYYNQRLPTVTTLATLRNVYDRWMWSSTKKCHQCINDRDTMIKWLNKIVITLLVSCALVESRWVNIRNMVAADPLLVVVRHNTFRP